MKATLADVRLLGQAAVRRGSSRGAPWLRWWPRVAAQTAELALVAGGAVLAVAAGMLELTPLVRVPAGLLAVLVLPGYAISLALQVELDRFERWALAFILSLAATVGLALALDASPWGLAPAGLIFALGGVTVAAAALAALRQPRREGDTTLARFDLPRRLPFGRRPLAGAAVALLSVVALALGLSVGGSGGPATEFFVLGETGLARGYPLRAAVGETIALELGIANGETAPVAFRVNADLDGTPVAAIPTVEVPAAGSSRIRLAFVVGAAPGERALRIDLYRGTDEQPNRSLRLWLTVLDPMPSEPDPTASPAPTTSPGPTPRSPIPLPGQP